MITNLRKFDGESPVEMCFNSNTSPLIKLTKDGGVFYYTTKTEKKSALTERKDDDKFIIAWPGRWRTDVFELVRYDILMALTL